MRSSSIFIFFEVIFHFSFFFRSFFIFFGSCLSSWIKIRLHTENQLPRLTGSALKVPVVVGWWVPTHYQVKLQLMLKLSWTMTTSEVILQTHVLKGGWATSSIMRRRKAVWAVWAKIVYCDHLHQCKSCYPWSTSLVCHVVLMLHVLTKSKKFWGSNFLRIWDVKQAELNAEQIMFLLLDFVVVSFKY